MASFAQVVESWHDFYIMAGTASATLLGLLFVGVSLNLEAIAGRDDLSLNALASQTFGNFVFTLFFSITMLIPDQTPLGVGIPFLVMGAFGVLSNLRYARDALGHAAVLGGWSFVFWRFILPLLAYLGLVVVSIFVLAGRGDVLYGLIAVIVILLLSAVRNSWDLLIRVQARARSSERTGGHS